MNQLVDCGIGYSGRILAFRPYRFDYSIPRANVSGVFVQEQKQLIFFFGQLLQLAIDKNFLFPLVNNLPYFFGIRENIPQAPAALVLFLFFAAGVLLHTLFSGASFRSGHKIVRPVFLFSLLVFLSGIITFLRYANFYPFRSGVIDEWTVNLFGVTAGGAIMSVVLTALNYLSGMALVLILLKTAGSERFRDRAVRLLCLGAALSFAFGACQWLFARGLGNSSISMSQRLINATFKDSMSLGGFIALAAPLFLAAAVVWKGGKKAWAVVPLVLAVPMVFASGSKGGLLGLILALVLFAVLARPLWRKRPSPERPSKPWARPALLAAVLVLAVLAGVLLTTNKRIAQSGTVSRLRDFFSQGAFNVLADWRGPLWESALKMTARYPATGAGAGAYIIELPNVHPEFQSREVPQSAENYVLQVGAEFGFPGLILVLWMAAVIVPGVVRSFRNPALPTKDRLLAAGILSGMAAFLVVGVFHTFIGSYEVKYTLWLLAGLGLGLEKREKEAGPAPKKSRGFQIAAVTAVLLVSGIQLWNATHSLSLESRSRSLGLNHEFGLYPPEIGENGKEFRWTKARACMTFVLPKETLIVPLRAGHPDLQAKPVSVRLYLVEDFSKKIRFLEEFKLTRPKWVWKLFSLPEDVGKRLTLLIEVNRTWSPHQAYGSPDRRNLGVGLRNLWWRDRSK